MSKVFYIPHGGGPRPLMGDQGYARLAAMLRELNAEVAGSKAVILVTAHWEAAQPCITTAARPGMLFDYHGFPEETYEYTYEAPGAPELAVQVGAALAGAGFDMETDANRGFDHGTFVPMMLIRPEADIPILQMSLLSSLNPEQHLSVGRALANLLDQNITLIGSGFSFHNIGALVGRLDGDTSQGQSLAQSFHAWLDETVCGAGLDPGERRRRLISWETAPGARFCHPREEHLLPLHVCHGAAAEAGMMASRIFGEPVKGFQTSGYRW
jgi:4,5-DOPA dioxygenase extradiol